MTLICPKILLSHFYFPHFKPHISISLVDLEVDPWSHLLSLCLAGLHDQWTSPLTTRCPTPCQHQGTLTPPKSEYKRPPWILPAEVFRLPRSPEAVPVRLATSLFSLPLFFPKCLCVCSWVCEHSCFVFSPCGSQSWMWTGLPYSGINDVEQRKTLTGAAPHLLKGKG